MNDAWKLHAIPENQHTTFLQIPLMTSAPGEYVNGISSSYGAGLFVRRGGKNMSSRVPARGDGAGTLDSNTTTDAAPLPRRA